MEFIPTYLYIKRHSITGKCYFGKTTNPDPTKYSGSGKYWKAHIKVHGRKFVETLWFKLFEVEEECRRVALLFSEQQDIVKSELWLNMIVETGVESGMPTGSKHREETKKKISIGGKGRIVSKETKARISNIQKGRKHSAEHIENQARTLRGRTRPPEVVEKSASKLRGITPTEETKLKISMANKGKPKTEDHRRKLAEANLGKKKSVAAIEKWKTSIGRVKCPHCIVVGATGNMKRWHFNNCKNKPND
jgi:hypothetical protein